VSRRRPLVLACALTGVLSSAGCGWPFVLEDEAPAAATTTTSAAPEAPEPPVPVEVARASLTDTYDGTDYSGTLSVTRSGPEPGIPPMRGWFPQDCDLPPDGPAATTTVGLRFADTSRLAMATAGADVELLGPDGAPPPAGAALFVEWSVSDARWCQDGTTTPTRDRLVAGAAEGDVVSIYVVSRDGAALTGAVLRISGLRNPGPNASGPWDQVTAVSGGCPGEADALCVPLA
jgi:hypothetical protein